MKHKYLENKLQVFLDAKPVVTINLFILSRCGKLTLLLETRAPKINQLRMNFCLRSLILVIRHSQEKHIKIVSWEKLGWFISVTEMKLPKWKLLARG